MKTTNIRMLRWAFVAILCLCGVASLLFVNSPKADAAGSFSFINANNAADSIAAGNNSRFIFINPTQILDKTTNKTYNTQATTDCSGGGANIINCSPGQPINYGVFWFWPNSTGAAPTPTGSPATCASALVLQVAVSSSDTTTETVGAQLFIVNSQVSTNGTSCFVPQTNGQAVPSIVGGQTSQSDSDIIAGPVAGGSTSDITPTDIAQANVVELTKDNGSDQTMLQAMATEFSWVSSSEIISYNGVTFAPASASELQEITTGIGNDTNGLPSITQGSNAPFNSNNYNYFVADSTCFNSSSNDYDAFLAVPKSGPSTITIFYQDGSASSPAYTDYTWQGSNQQCLINQVNHSVSPDFVWQVNQGDDDTTIGISNTALASATSPPASIPGYTGLSATGVTSNLSADSSCQNDGGFLSWIMCDALDGLANTVGGIYTSVILPMLNVPPLDASTGGSAGAQALKTAWSDFRVYGNIFLVIALLVVVFGEAIGGGLIDAYTAKKVLPRILAAAVMINLSFYIVAALVDIFNVIGGGLGSLITSGFGMGTIGNAHFVVNANGATGAGVVTITGGVVAIGIAGIVPHLFGAIAAGQSGIAGVASLMEGLLFAILLPALMVFLAIMITLIIRLGLIYLLVVLSPIAFACYVLPNTERYFKKWWEVLRETLMIFPIISALFALSIVLSQSTVWATESRGFVTGGIGYIISLLMLIVPLGLIPFAFKMAGDVIGRLHEAIDGARVGIHEMPGLKSIRERNKQKASQTLIQGRQKFYSDYQGSASVAGKSAVRRGATRFLAGRIGGYNIEQAASGARAQVMKEINDQIATGKDDEVRGLTVNKQFALAADKKGEELWRIDKDSGKRQFKSAGGQWIDEADVDAGHRRWGRNTFAQQGAISYEFRKAQSEKQLQDLAKNYRAVAQGVYTDKDGVERKAGDGWHMNDQQAAGTWIGAAFEHQNQHLEFKYTDWKTGKIKQDKAGGFVDELYEKKGSYPLAQMSSNTIEQLKEAFKQAVQLGDTDRQQKITAISETFMHDYGSQIGATGEEGQPIMGPPRRPPVVPSQVIVPGGAPAPGATGYAGAPGAQDIPGATGAAGTPGRPGNVQVVGVPTAYDTAAARRQANTPGAAHVAERVRELAALTGTASNWVQDQNGNWVVGTPGQPPSGLYGPAHTVNTPTENRREQS